MIVRKSVDLRNQLVVTNLCDSIAVDFKRMKKFITLAFATVAALLLPSCLVVADGGMYQPDYGHRPSYGSGYQAPTGSYYRQQGQMAGRRDARYNRPYNPQPSEVGAPSKHRDEFNKGYRDGYGDRGQSGANPFEQQEAYNRGRTYGQADARSGASAKPSRHDHTYKKSTADSFKRGYYDGYR